MKSNNDKNELTASWEVIGLSLGFGKLGGAGRAIEEVVKEEVLAPKGMPTLELVEGVVIGGRRNSCIIQSVLVPLPALPR